MTAQADFVALLRKMFQIEDLDLDFGIYRVLNQERKIIEDFLDNRLGEITRKALGAADDSQRSTVETELENLAKGARDLGMEPEATPKWKEKKAELDALGTSDALETDVYNGLTDFFGRYYDKGDFLSRPRYRKDVYALPYNGEEVKLHWANRDQYYIKSAQILETFEWKLDDLRVQFQLREASVAENNNKEERRFVLALDENEKPVVTHSDNTLTVFFDFKKVTGGARDLNADAERRLTEWTEGVALVAPILAPFSDKKSHFLHRLNSWTARGSFDFFVHKNLKAFLTRELDFYLKNEVVQLDSLFAGDATQWQKTTLNKAKAVHALGGKIIEFLASLENLQKRLWEKQKWVTQSRLIVPLRLVPQTMVTDVLNNSGQTDEWKALYSVQGEPVSTENLVAWSEPPSLEWAESHGDIAVDSKHFLAEWTRRLWSELSKDHTLDQLWNGVLWNADNFAALNVMRKRFAETIQCVYIDPPYNTGSDGFLYKDAYQHSSWLSMMQDRLELTQHLMTPDAICCVTVDDHEVHRADMVMGSVFGEENRAACAPWKSEASGGKEKTGLRTGHEYVLIYHNGDNSNISQSESSTGDLNREDKWGSYRKGRELRKWGGDSLRQDRPGQWYGLPTPDGSIAFPYRNDGKEGHWRWGQNNPEIVIAKGEPDVFHWELAPFDSNVSIDGNTHRWVPYVKIRQESKTVGWTTWLDKAGTNADATRVLKELFDIKPFSTPKPVSLYEWLADIINGKDGLFLDHFAGSGTTGHAVINLNRADGDEGQRRFILAEMGRYFDSVLVPRLKKAAFAEKWGEGKPIDYPQRNGVPQTLFVYELESYEDALEHLASAIAEKGQPAFDVPDDDFTVRYALSVNTRDGELPLADELFQAPFAMEMRVGNGDGSTVDNNTTPNGNPPASRKVKLDAISTFNWLSGLRVHKMWFPDAENPKIAAVCGLTPDDRAVVVVWRHLRDETYETADAALWEFWQNDEILKSWRENHDVKTVYINGDSTLWRSQTESENWLCEPLESTFRNLMFASSPTTGALSGEML
ncbi:MAG TPA: site-specific DNA-methyltransferase [Abditibacteriaceae bacterium]|jgi:adenine-specific DNA-methyltransferase